MRIKLRNSNFVGRKGTLSAFLPTKFELNMIIFHEVTYKCPPLKTVYGMNCIAAIILSTCIMCGHVRVVCRCMC